MRNFKFITIEELKKNITQYNILDIRREDDIENKSFENYYTLKDIDKLDKSSKVVIVCYKGFSAQGFAEELFEQEFEDLYVLEGGISSL